MECGYPKTKLLVAHDYTEEEIISLFGQLVAQAPKLVEVFGRVERYRGKFKK